MNKMHQARHIMHCWQSKDELRSDILVWIDWQKLTFINSVQTLGAVEKTYLDGCLVGMTGKRKSRKFMLSVCLDDDDVDDDGHLF